MHPHFKRPLRVTGWVFLAMLAIMLAITWSISRERISDRAKRARAEQLGKGLGMLTALVLAPVWLHAAAKVGKERREARERKARGEPAA